ncbi:outer membrane beta-barrel family protein [Mucilaginibacter puniceus]
MIFNIAKSFFFVIFILFAATAAAQNGGTVSGSLIDGANNQPLPFASVVLAPKDTSQSPKSMQSDIDGNFTITDVADGAYTLKASYIGYLSYTKDTLIASPDKNNINFGKIVLTPAKGVLQEVSVTAQRSQIQLGVDKKIFSVSESLVSQGGSATDLLANVPSVQVDVDGNLSLRGSGNVRVLINGKQSALTGSNLADILASMPASSIENIEVITNPSSKYDAEGQSGIINIVLKKNVKAGLTGSVSATAGNQNTINGSVNLAYQNKKINVYGNYSYRKADRNGNGFSTKTTMQTATDGTVTNQYTNQQSNQLSRFGGHNIRSGIDFYLNDKNTLSFSNNINIRDRNQFQNGNTTVTQNGAPYQTQDQNNVSTGNGTNVNFNLDFEHKFDKKDEVLTANFGYSTGFNNNNNKLSTVITNYLPPILPSNIYNNFSSSNDKDFNIQADYTLPLENGRFEAGYRSMFDKSDDDFMVNPFDINSGTYYYNPLLSNNLIYKQNVNAIYGNYQHQFGKFGIQGGLRLEDTRINFDLYSAGAYTPNKQNYFRVYPTLFLTNKFNDNQTLQLSYSRRISRPNGRELSPFLDVSNVLNYSQGNPALKPEDTHSFELSYINYWRSLVVTSSVYYRLTNDNIQRVSTLLNANTTLSTSQNLKSASNAGYELIAKITPSSIFDLTANLNVYYRRIEGYAAYNIATTSGFSWNGNLTASIKPTKKLGFQLRGDYQAAQVAAQGRNRARYGLDAAIKYDITKSLNFSVNSRNILNSRKFISETRINNANIVLDQYAERNFQIRTILFTLSYRFGGSNKSSTERKNRDKDDRDNGQTDEYDDMGAAGPGL